MNLDEAVDRACQEPTLQDALAWIADWEADRAIRQALEWQRTGISTAAHGNWDTCFKVCFGAVIAKHADRVCPQGPRKPRQNLAPREFWTRGLHRS